MSRQAGTDWSVANEGDMRAEGGMLSLSAMWEIVSPLGIRLPASYSTREESATPISSENSLILMPFSKRIRFIVVEKLFCEVKKAASLLLE